MPVLMIFIDGIGIGEFDPEKNPFARFPSPYFSFFKNRDQENPIPHDGIMIPTDPAMGIAGLPQSATGQTALLTGVNASKALNRHLSGFPTITLKKILKEESIFLKLQKLGKTATFANAFTPEYFQRSERQISATTWSVKASNFRFRMVAEELWHDEAISHDLTNEFLADLGYAVPIRTPEQAAKILARIAESVDFCLFEYFLTDLIGHKNDLEWAGIEIKKLSVFLETLLTTLNLNERLVLLTSDHGNFEDLHVSTHTNNFVPTIVWGKDRSNFAASFTPKIENVTNQILACIQKH